jgi:BRCA1-associated protein
VSTIQDESVREQLSSDLLSSIHPFLAEHGNLIGVVSACREQGESAAADVILIDVSNAPQHWLHDIKASLNGEHMARAPSAVIKLVPISSIFLTATDPRSPDSASSKTLSEIPTCSVCLHRIDPLRLGMPKPQNHQLCSKFCPGIVAGEQQGDTCRNQHFLRPWPCPSNCVACHVIHDRWKNYMPVSASNTTDDKGASAEKGDLFCHQCAMQETLWVCLTCGFVGCGRYSHRHAAQHFEESGHPYSLELATLRIWDYSTSEFAHRLDLLECPSVQRLDGQLPVGAEKPMHQATSYYDPNMMNDMVSPAVSCSFEETSPKKANMIGEEYEALLQSALEDQAQHYEGEITRLRAELTAENVDAGAMTKEEMEIIDNLKADVARFRAEIDRVSRQLLDAQAQEAGYRADSQRLLREQSVAKDLLDKIQEEAARENMEGQMQMEELEQQVADLTANLRMRHQFSQDEELSNSQIFGTRSSNANSGKRGKKLRRLFRK